MRVCLFARIVLFFAAMVGLAADQRVWEPADMINGLDPLPKSSVPRELVTRLRVGTANIVLEQTMMKEVQALLGGQSMMLPVPLQLGASEVEVIKVLGRPTVRSNDILFYVHEHEELLLGETFQTSNIIAVAVREGVVEAIQVSRVTVN